MKNITLFLIYSGYFTFTALCSAQEIRHVCNAPTNCGTIDSKYRTIDGSCNNNNKPHLGQSYRPYVRIAPNTYSDGRYAIPRQKSGNPLPLARDVSIALFPLGNKTDSKFTITLMQMGQIVTHDIALVADTLPNETPLTPGCCTFANKYGADQDSEKCANDIKLPPNDPTFSKAGFQCFAFPRTSTTLKYGCENDKYVEQISAVTSWLDLQIIYGNYNERAQRIREFEGGRMKSERRTGVSYPPQTDNLTNLCVAAASPEERCYFFGDNRANQNPQLTSLHLVFFNEHNRLANELSKLNPDWDDERLFQEARRINIAQYQRIVYYEILPGYIGKENMIKNNLIYPGTPNCINDYDQNADPSPIQEFSTGAWRYFHSLVISNLKLFNKSGKCVGVTDMTNWIDRGAPQEMDSILNYQNLIRGMISQKQGKSDNIEDVVVKSQFNKDNATGLGIDLTSFDIQRGRDNGVSHYLAVRKWCDLPVPRSWDEMASVLPKTAVSKLQALYETPEDIELMAGGSLEPFVSGTLMGPTFLCLVTTQFRRQRTADRFFFENCETNGFTSSQLDSIRRVTLARLICDNTDTERIQPRVVELAKLKNLPKSCSCIPGLNLNLWKENQ